LHARAERKVGSSSKCCDGTVSGDPAISGTREISGDGCGRRGRLLSSRSKMGKSVSESWAGSTCTQIKRRPRRTKGSLTKDQGRDRRVSARKTSITHPIHLPPDSAVCRGHRRKTPCYGTVYDLVREVPGSLLTLAHHGSKAYSEGFDLVHRREAARANAIWQVDHAQLNILLLRGDGQTARPWLSLSELFGVLQTATITRPTRIRNQHFPTPRAESVTYG
jgi:hypothetical protein